MRTQQAISVGSNYGFCLQIIIIRFYCAWRDHDLLRGDASSGWFNEFGCSPTDRCARRCLSIPEFTEVLVVHGWYGINDVISGCWIICNNWLGKLLRYLRRCIVPVGVDYYIWALQISGIGTTISGINFFVTIIKMRCPGMTLIEDACIHVDCVML